MTGATKIELRRHLPRAVVATFYVTALPLVAAAGFGPGPGSLAGWLALSVALSLAASFVASALWMQRTGSGGVVFGDLMLWGWLHRLLTDRQLARVTADLGLRKAGWETDRADNTPARQAQILQDLASALEARDPYTHGHSKRVTRYACLIAKAMGLSEDAIEDVRIAASVHDVGKLFIPLRTLHKITKLTDEELSTIRSHAAIGAEMVSRIGYPKITDLVRHHHERVDGAGYPDRLSGDQIPLGARIIAVADTFDAITSTRSYKAAGRHAQAITVLKREAGKQLDPRVVDTFLSYHAASAAARWWGAAFTAPRLVIGRLGLWSRSTGAASLLQGAAAVGAAVLIGGVLTGPFTSSGVLGL